MKPRTCQPPAPHPSPSPPKHKHLCLAPCCISQTRPSVLCVLKVVHDPSRKRKTTLEKETCCKYWWHGQPASVGGSFLFKPRGKSRSSSGVLCSYSYSLSPSTWKLKIATQSPADPLGLGQCSRLARRCLSEHFFPPRVPDRLRNLKGAMVFGTVRLKTMNHLRSISSRSCLPACRKGFSGSLFLG